MSDRPIVTPDDHPEDAVLADRLRDVLAERGRATNGDVRAILDAIPGLPDRDDTSGRSWIAAAAAVVMLAIGGALVLGQLSLPRVGGPADRVGREAFADDPRLVRCEQQTGTASQVFEMIHASWFPMYFPGWYRGAPELEVDDPALVVIGKQYEGGLLGAAPEAKASVPTPTRPPSYFLCVAIGSADDAVIRTYGPTHFDRVVPVLSEVDVARAAHLDPDVLADPAVFAYPDRLAPCGGVTGDELYIFEASRLEDFPLYFPNADPVPELNVDVPAIVVVYRNPLAIGGRLVAPSYARSEHDLCIAIELDNANPDHLVLPQVDTTGFHVRIDGEIAEPPILAPGATPFPSPPTATPEPLPAWAGDAKTAIQCVGEAVDIDLGSVPFGASPSEVMLNAGTAVRLGDLPLPASGFVPTVEGSAANLYTYSAGGHIRAAIAIVFVGGNGGTWFVASAAACDPSEFDPSTPVGSRSIGQWRDGDGNVAPIAVLRTAAECYGGTAVWYRNRLYVRIPNGGVPEELLETTWSPDAVLRGDELDTGLRSGGLRLLEAVDHSALYIVGGPSVEQLPHIRGDAIERTSCS